jgi:enterochelin esterase-like enzyme
MKNKSEILTIKNFYANKLNNKRDIYVYLPPSYTTKVSKKYPVLYMHDGQYSFSKSENSGGSWNVHKVVDELISEDKIKEIIIVAIPNMGSERGSEYAHDKIPFIHDLGLEEKGLLYEDFLINDLKPYIDEKFRTLTDGKNTALIGSSMGGLVTYNIGFRNPSVFSNLGIMSPYLVSMDAETLVEKKNYRSYNNNKPHKVWVDIGEYEGLILVRHVRQFVDELLQQGLVPEKEIMYYNVPGAAHFEEDWSERISKPLLYFFGNIGKKISVQLNGRKTAGLVGIKVQINPVVEFDSGFSMSDINGNCISEDPNIFEISTDGIIIPKNEGEAKVIYSSEGIETSVSFTITKLLTELVTIKINVNAPVNTPEDRPITLNEFKLKKICCGKYRGEIIVPRDIGLTYKFARGNSFINPLIEQDSQKKDIPYRSVKASEDLELNCTVESWKDI